MTKPPALVLDALNCSTNTLLYSTLSHKRNLILFSFFCLPPSDEDTQIKDLVESWLNKLPPERSSELQGWIDKYFYSALESVLAKSSDYVVDTSQVGVVMNEL